MANMSNDLIVEFILEEILEIKFEKNKVENEPYWHYNYLSKEHYLNFPDKDPILFCPDKNWDQIFWIFGYLRLPFSMGTGGINICGKWFDKRLTKMNVLDCLVEWRNWLEEENLR